MFIANPPIEQSATSGAPNLIFSNLASTGEVGVVLEAIGTIVEKTPHAKTILVLADQLSEHLLMLVQAFHQHAFLVCRSNGRTTTNGRRADAIRTILGEPSPRPEAGRTSACPPLTRLGAIISNQATHPTLQHMVESGEFAIDVAGIIAPASLDGLFAAAKACLPSTPTSSGETPAQILERSSREIESALTTIGLDQSLFNDMEGDLASNLFTGWYMSLLQKLAR